MNNSRAFTEITMSQALSVRYMAGRALPWLISIVLVALFTWAMLILQTAKEKPTDTVTVRKIDVALPPPPPPPPLDIQKPQAQTETPTIDLIGMGAEPAMKYSTKPELGMENIEKIKQPKFDPESINIQKSLSVNFPLIDVNNLDTTPRSITRTSSRFPSSLINKGIREVFAKVELIIDQKGNAYVKRIVDPVYPEMIPAIRHWVNNVKFTIPTKNGKPVQAMYPYTVHFSYRVN